MIFLDWDDTLFPTTEIFCRWGVPLNPKKWSLRLMTFEQRRQLRAYGDVLIDYVEAVCRRSDRVVIVTNASTGWVQDCVNFFVPRARPLFCEKRKGLRIVYARDVYSDLKQKTAFARPVVLSGGPQTKEEMIEEKTAWKYTAFCREAKRFYGRGASAERERAWDNILSVGDSLYEKAALQDLAFRRVGPASEQLRAKSICVAPNRSLAAVTDWLRSGQGLLDEVVAFDGSRDVTACARPPQRAHRRTGSEPPCGPRAQRASQAQAPARARSREPCARPHSRAGSKTAGECEVSRGLLQGDRHIRRASMCPRAPRDARSGMVREALSQFDAIMQASCH